MSKKTKDPKPPVVLTDEQVEAINAVFPADMFTCKQCGHEVPANYSIRTPDYCYLCDPAITLGELLSDEPLPTQHRHVL